MKQSTPTTTPSIPKPPATLPSVVQRIPGDAFDTFAGEAIRQGRDIKLVIKGAALAFTQLPPAQRDAFTIGEPMSDADRAKLGLKPAASVKRNTRKGGAR